ncbi:MULTISPECIES: PAS domain-containing protein [Streptomyces]|uniref:Diguanylate cyclase n=1 Tax=Streptomyces venezuelae TaxID=54571 RepID=A0A5P2BME2_STRVZ|nr:PAS domain-containing protein [Streptomyces venezuelae]MYY84946.1 PAS domain-containing protein [Streptomyces sp. SID335]MYZ16791.1 PAS domain-containing protein [Streptomyces sp. SID337]NDZ84665.1 PAS domain-containing protein [Streptomyces sp. SID10115]NEB49330.1 PAS domain-containing protein [Streptomyces sp. SID339]QES31553.1 diguanylate cyclase [Streptomyces venezuelae]
MSASRQSGTTDELGPEEPEPGGAELLAALLDGMDAALCAFDADGVVTHWNREAERILGWTAAEAVGRHGFTGWAVRPADAGDVEERLLSAMDAPGRQVHEFALVTKDGGRVLVRMQSASVRGGDGKSSGVYCAFSEVHAQIDLERSIALSEALFETASWGVVLVDADLRPAVVNEHAARAFGVGRSAVLGRPLADLLGQGVEELESALTHVLAEGTPPAPAEMWVTVRAAAGGEDDGEARRCWRSGFLRLASPLAEEPVPLGVGWLFLDVTEAKQAEQDASQLRFRSQQLHRAARATAECEDPTEAATVQLDFALAGFADHALVDLLAGEDPVRLVRTAATPAGPPGPCRPVATAGIPVRYPEGHPAPQCVERVGSVRASAGVGASAERVREWAAARQWPEDSVHALCVVLRSRGRTLGVVTFLRGAGRGVFDRSDAAYAESVASRVAVSLDLSQVLSP